MGFNYFIDFLFVLLVIWVLITAFFILRYTYNGRRVRAQTAAMTESMADLQAKLKNIN